MTPAVELGSPFARLASAHAQCFVLIAMLLGCGSNPSSESDHGAGSGGATAAETAGAGGAQPDPGTVLVRADFQSRSPGSYRQDMVAGDFSGTPAWNNGLNEGRAQIVQEGDERFLRITYVGNSYGPVDGGVQFLVPLEDSYEELFLAYRVRFAAGFEFVQGGKLPGLVGGTHPTGCSDDTAGFSARMMWRSAGAAVQYMYYPEKSSGCGDDFDYAVEFVPGEWHTVEHRLVMNTPGEPDGVLQAWYDGEMKLDEQAFVYRLSGADFAIDGLYFSTFFGGNDDSWSPSAVQVVDMDDFVIATGPITH